MEIKTKESENIYDFRASLINQKEISLSEYKGKVILIDKLVVDKDFRRQGIGTALLTSVISLVTENMPLIAFPVRMDNVEGQLFLRDCVYGSKKIDDPNFNLYNFHHCGFIRNYFSNGETASVFLYKKSPFKMLTYQGENPPVS